MTKMKKIYLRPALELIPTEPFYLLDGSKQVSGYAIDNDDADPESIFPIVEDPTDPDDDDDFVDID